IVQRVLAELGLTEQVLLWNVVPTHPGTATSNRAPTRAEVAAGRVFADELAKWRRVLAVGRIAHAALGGTYVRHPSHGGAAGCAPTSGALVFLGLGLCGAGQTIVLLSRAASAEMFPPERRARGMSIVLFGVVSGAIWGPLVFGPMFSGREYTAADLVVPWIAAGVFTFVGLLISFGVRPDPKELSRRYATPGET